MVATKSNVSPTPIVLPPWLAMATPKDVLTLATVSLAVRVPVARKTTNLFVTASPDSNPPMDSVLTSMNAANLDPATPPRSAGTHLDLSLAPVRKAVWAMLGPPVANLVGNALPTGIAQPLQLVAKAVVWILALVNVVKEPCAKLSDINPSARVPPEPKAILEYNVGNWNVWKTPSVPSADHVFRTNVLTLAP